MRLISIGLLFLGPLLGNNRAQDLNASATIHVGTIMPYDIQDTEYGQSTAHVQGSGSSPEGSVYSGLATVGLGSESPFLAAAVSGTAPSDQNKYAIWRTGGSASASVYDELQLTGQVPAGVIKSGEELKLVEITLAPSVSGNLTGNAEAKFTFSVWAADDFWQMKRNERSWDTTWETWSDPSGHSLTTTGPSAVVVQLALQQTYDTTNEAYTISSPVIALSMRLDVTATAYPGYMSSSAEFEHTASLGAIRIGATNGTALAWTSYLQVSSVNNAPYKLVPYTQTPVITAFKADSTSFTLTWASAIGTTYHVQRSDGSFSWEDIGSPLTATTNSATFIDTNLPPDSTALFYRVRFSR